MRNNPTAIVSTLMSTANGFFDDVTSADNDSAFFEGVTAFLGVTFSIFFVSLTSLGVASSLGGVSGAESPSPYEKNYFTNFKLSPYEKNYLTNFKLLL